MKKSKVQAVVAAFVMAALLGGCGDEPYELTEAERAVIVNYSAHIVTKYNSYQGEGLSYVIPVEETEEDTWDQAAEGDAGAEESAAPEEPVIEDPVVDLPEATLNDLFGQAGITLDYVGARLTTSYVQDDYYALYPNEGKQYLVLGVDIINTTTVPMAVDLLSMTPKFEVLLRGNVKAKSENTLLLSDFTVFEGTLAPGETRETVILFQVPADVFSLEAMIVTADNGTGKYEVILQNQ